MFPIKFIENNLIWNKDGEVYAYYELIPYNYAFLSEEQKMLLSNDFEQLIVQYGQQGKIHALQLATESSVTKKQETGKRLIKGNLKEIAVSRIDEQTSALVDMIGDTEVDYRFFIGFKLIVKNEELNINSLKKMLVSTVKEFLNQVNHNLMNDFVSVNNDEIERYLKLERLLENKIIKRFKMRRLDKNDIGYILEHIYAKKIEVYEDYIYTLPKHENPTSKIVREYDLIRPTRCVITEKQRYLTLEHEDEKTYATYLVINNITQDLVFPSSEIFYKQQQQFDFAIDTSMHVELIENKNALGIVRRKKEELKDLDNHAFSNGSETGNTVLNALESVGDLDADLESNKEAMYKLSYIIRVTANDEEELKKRVDEVKDFYDDFKIKLVRPAGDMLGLHEEFIPTRGRYINDYVQYVKVDFLSILGFGATSQLGEKNGFYLGYSVDTGKNVYIQPWLAAQGIKGAVTNALASAFIGSLGGGKSFSNNLIVYYSVLYGAKAVVLDPKSERGVWKEKLADISHEMNIVNLTSDIENQGLLDPFVIMKNIKDAENLAVDTLTFLTGISARDGEKFPVLRQAISRVAQSDKRGLMLVIDELKNENTPTSISIANHIQSFMDYNIAQLLFSNGEVEYAISLDKQINIIQVADLVLPDKEKKFEDWTMTEMLSVSMMIIISTFCLDFIHTDRRTFKIVDLDEAWTFLNVSQGEALSNKLIRAGRSMNAGVYFVTQSATDVSKETFENNIGMKFAFRSKSLKEVKHTLKFFGLDEEDEYNQQRLMSLENGQCLFQDIYGRVGIVQVHAVFQDLFDAFDTRPPMKFEEVEE